MDVITIAETMVLFDPDSVNRIRSVESFHRFAGGAENNTLIGLSRIGYDTKMISFMGDDEFGKYLIMCMKAEGVDVTDIKKVSKEKTGIFFVERSLTEDCKSYYYRDTSAMRKLGSDDITDQMFSDAKILYLTGITPLISDSCCSAIYKAVDIAKNNKMKIVLDPNIRLKMASIEKIREIIMPIIEKCDYLLPNEQELKLLFPEKTKEETVDYILSKGVQCVVIKKGEEGADAFTANGKFSVNAYKLDKIASTMGAGDAFNAGFISGIIDKDDIDKCLKKGCAMGAFAVMCYDPYLMLPEREELINFMEGKKNNIVR